MKLFASWKRGLTSLARREININYQITPFTHLAVRHFGMKSLALALAPSLHLKLSLISFTKKCGAQISLSVLVFFQGLPTTTVSPHYGLHCPLRTTTTPYPTSLPTAWTETPWGGDATPFTPLPRVLETGQLPRSRSSCKTAGYSTVTSRWRPGQSKYSAYIFLLFFYSWHVYLTLISRAHL